MKISPLERWMISNQLKILESLYPEDAESLAVQREAVECGYEFAYDIIPPVDPDTMTEEEGREVWDTLDMFRAIDYSIGKLGTNDFEDHSQRRFRGYDGNIESNFMAFTSYTVKRLGRWTDLPMEKPDYFNSHYPMRDRYKRMLEEWKRISSEKRFSMTQDQVKAVLDAA